MNKEPNTTKSPVQEAIGTAFRSIRTSVPPIAMEELVDAFADLHENGQNGTNKIVGPNEAPVSPNPAFLDLLQNNRLARMVWRTDPHHPHLRIVGFYFYVYPPEGNYRGQVQQDPSFRLRTFSKGEEADFTKWELLP
ncbi:hypothetical protein HN709_01100 [Candidatus Peregrinibacteria bacterium]|mgnify:CR=1 FL=1|jgi:hypothetical protein|nr:hypothetical protein [Candidatus Peregrinibacteria bacterium]MBT7736261.1 hypothetical protein [Candidatus Peregrinibacteria bacterium]